MADRVSSQSKKKTRNFGANVCGSLYSTFKTKEESSFEEMTQPIRSDKEMLMITMNLIE